MVSKTDDIPASVPNCNPADLADEAGDGAQDSNETSKTRLKDSCGRGKSLQLQLASCDHMIAVTPTNDLIHPLIHTCHHACSRIHLHVASIHVHELFLVWFVGIPPATPGDIYLHALCDTCPQTQGGGLWVLHTPPPPNHLLCSLSKFRVSTLNLV